jgi:hypothetical protein
MEKRQVQAYISVSGEDEVKNLTHSQHKFLYTSTRSFAHTTFRPWFKRRIRPQVSSIVNISPIGHDLEEIQGI